MRSPVIVVCSLLTVVTTVSLLAVSLHAAPGAQQTYIPLLAGQASPSDSLNVTPQLDNSHVSSATIPLAGGQVVATGADGTRYTLSIPPAALNQTTTFTLIPIAQIAGLPDVQLVAAVEIKPLHVALFQAALLKIEAAQPLPVNQEYPFAYYNDGEDFHPYPIQPYSEGVVFPIGQFQGGYGIAREGEQVTTAYITAPAFTPANPEARLRSQLAALIKAERVRIKRGEPIDPTLWSKVSELALKYYASVLKPLLPQIALDCKFSKANLGKVMGWRLNIVTLVGDLQDPESDPGFIAAGNEIDDTVKKATENCYREAIAPCFDRKDPNQVNEVYRHYRTLLFTGDNVNVHAPNDVKKCALIDVTLQSGAFHHVLERDPKSGWDTKVHYQFVDDSVSGVGIYIPYRTPSPGNTGASVSISITALISDVWQPVPLNNLFLCRDQIAERVQELVITYRGTSREPGGEPLLPPQVYADNIGCWRWTGSVRHDQDYDNLGSAAYYYYHISAEVTLERQMTIPYIASPSNEKIIVNGPGFRLISPGTVEYDHKAEYFDQEGHRRCLQTLRKTIDDPAAYVEGTLPALRVPNASFGAPREVSESIGQDLHVDSPYITQGSCPHEGDTLDVIIVPLAGELSADGRQIELNETGSVGGSGTFELVINLQALRE